VPTVDGPDAQDEFPKELPTFAVPQSDGTIVTLDFTTPGPFGDFAFTARMTGADGTLRERIYGAYHTDEAAIFVEILQHWARVAHPGDILAGLDRADAVRRFLTDLLEPTTQSENDFGDLLRRGIEPLAVMNFLPTDHEHSDERGDTIALSPRGSDLVWISPHTPRTTFSVPPSHLWVFVTGMMWRTYDSGGLPLSRLNTAAYETAIATFRRAIRGRSQMLWQPEPPGAADREGRDENTTGTPELVERLRELLGSKLVAYLSSAPDTRTVREWADPKDVRTPPDDVVDRLRIAHQVATLLSEKDSAAVIQVWLQGRNPLLDDVAPARLLRDSTLDIAGPSVMAAARAFAASPENPKMRDPRHA
jgi:hypothetical protein